MKPHRNRRVPPGFIVYALLIVALTASGDFLAQRYAVQRHQTRQFTRVQVELGVVRASIESVITANLQIVDPVAGNEALLGIDYRDLPEQWPDALRAKETGSMPVSGPLRLVQGGTGIVGRVPVFTTIDGQSEFWGLVSSMIDFDALMSEITDLVSDLDLVIAIAKNPPADSGSPGDPMPAVVWGTPGLIEAETSASMDIILPDARWRLFGAPTDGWYARAPEAPAIHLSAGLLGLLLLLFEYLRMTKTAELRASEQRFRDVTRSSSDWIWEVDTNGVYVYASGRVHEILGYEPDELIGRTPFSMMEDQEAQRVGVIFSRLVHDRAPIHELENWTVAKDGKRVCLLTSAMPILSGSGELVGYRGVDKDITTRKALQNQVEERTRELERYVAIVDAHVIISQTDLDGIITYASDAFCKISGYTKEELINQNHNIIRHPDMPDSLFADLWSTITSGRPWSGEFKNLKKDGGYYWVTADLSSLTDKDGHPYGYMAVRHDSTDKKRVEELSVTDRLTGLFNRIKLDQVVAEQHERLARYNETYALILLDIDHFKAINDTYGHLVGDSVLETLARLVKDSIRTTDVAGRWGGEEFLVVCPHTDAHGATATAEHLRCVIEDTTFPDVPSVTASFGVAAVDSSDDPDTLMKRVDDALYTAKRNGRNRVATASI